MSCLISSSVISPATGDASGKRTTISTSWSQCVKHNFVIIECEGKGNRIIQDRRLPYPWIPILCTIYSSCSTPEQTTTQPMFGEYLHYSTRCSLNFFGFRSVYAVWIDH